MSSVILFFGSFNPIHLGHLSLAKEALRLTQNDELWFIVSPNNPFKSATDLMPVSHRIEMIKLAIGANKRFKVSDIEVRRNSESFTSNTLKLLKEENPLSEFSILMGEDNVINIEKWKDPEYILNNFKIYVYPRQANKAESIPNNLNVEIMNCDYIDISATEIRKSIVENQPKKFYLPIGIYDYIKENKLL